MLVYLSFVIRVGVFVVSVRDIFCCHSSDVCIFFDFQTFLQIGLFSHEDGTDTRSDASEDSQSVQ